MKTLSELQIIAEGKYPHWATPNNHLGDQYVVNDKTAGIKRHAYIQGCLDTQGRMEYEMHVNMQFYYEYVERNGYVTPMDWIAKHKPF